MSRYAALCLLAVVAGAGIALGQPPAAGTQVRLRGTIVAFDGTTLSLRTARDGVVEFAVPATVGINGVARRSLDDIADDTFIGTTAARDADGRWRATEVHIFPEEMRGAGEGHYAWDFPETTMTNAAVTGAVSAGRGRALTLTHRDGETEVVVGPETDIVALTPGSRSMLVPGAAVFVLGLLDAAGPFAPLAIVAEQDGIKPPM